MKTYLIKTPSIISRIYSKYIWRFSTNKKDVYLTFDDGPTPEITPFVLDILKKYNAKATFFCIGKNIEKHPNLFKRIVDEGHSVGNHTQHHKNGWKTSVKSYIREVEMCDTIIHKFTVSDKKLFRPPYGKITNKKAKEIIKRGYKIVMWTVLSADFDSKVSKENCLQNVLKNTKKGNIIVFHDSLKASEKLKYVLPQIMKDFTLQKLTFKAIK
ncbi:polysaccharide deacetylase family protein [Polaribacter tangerinus]|uniref:polysaccharide deacetylase family protein n=1 Tax=Polaribacter tangerinus TaxID=1920034 RepID=UPI000B4B0E0F|nr:polysaccharide deacetylase family protein [Polaribacter tangerinus]